LVVAGWQWQEARLGRNEAQLQRDKTLSELLAIQARRTDTEAAQPDEIEHGAALAVESIEIAQEQPVC
jgi:hypothetical protein